MLFHNMKKNNKCLQAFKHLLNERWRAKTEFEGSGQKQKSLHKESIAWDQIINDSLPTVWAHPLLKFWLKLVSPGNGLVNKPGRT